MTTGQRIGQERKKRNLSQEALGEKMGVSRQAISKWESDAAVPDVDKLIGLSRLFGVTVGWLLGVEEEPGSADDAFTEQQLKLVEEIVRRHQPQTAAVERRPRRRVLKLVAALAVGWVLWSAWQDLNWKLDRNTVSTNNLDSSYHSIQSQLNSLSDRLDALTAGEKLTTEYEVWGDPWDNADGANLQFRVTPREYREGDTAAIAVRDEVQTLGIFEMEYDGAVWEKWVPLETCNGYSYYFQVTHSDGTREQQRLEDTGWEDMTDHLRGSYRVQCDAEIINNSLVFDSYSMELSAPAGGQTIDAVNWVIYTNGAEWRRELELVHEEPCHSLSSGGTGLHKYPLPDLSEGHTVLLCVEITLSGAAVETVDVVRFTMTDGSWVPVYFVYTD